MRSVLPRWMNGMASASLLRGPAVPFLRMESQHAVRFSARWGSSVAQAQGAARPRPRVAALRSRSRRVIVGESKATALKRALAVFHRGEQLAIQEGTRPLAAVVEDFGMALLGLNRVFDAISWVEKGFLERGLQPSERYLRGLIWRLASQQHLHEARIVFDHYFSEVPAIAQTFLNVLARTGLPGLQEAEEWYQDHQTELGSMAPVISRDLALARQVAVADTSPEWRRELEDAWQALLAVGRAQQGHQVSARRAEGATWDLVQSLMEGIVQGNMNAYQYDLAVARLRDWLTLVTLNRQVTIIPRTVAVQVAKLSRLLSEETAESQRLYWKSGFRDVFRLSFGRWMDPAGLSYAAAQLALDGDIPEAERVIQYSHRESSSKATPVSVVAALIRAYDDRELRALQLDGAPLRMASVEPRAGTTWFQKVSHQWHFNFRRQIFEALIQGAAHRGDFADADSWLAEMISMESVPGVGPVNSTYLPLVEACVVNDRVDQARDYLARARAVTTAHTPARLLQAASSARLVELARFLGEPPSPWWLQRVAGACLMDAVMGVEGAEEGREEAGQLLAECRAMYPTYTQLPGPSEEWAAILVGREASLVSVPLLDKRPTLDQKEQFFEFTRDVLAVKPLAAAAVGVVQTALDERNSAKVMEWVTVLCAVSRRSTQMESTGLSHRAVNDLLKSALAVGFRASLATDLLLTLGPVTPLVKTHLMPQLWKLAYEATGALDDGDERRDEAIKVVRAMAARGA